MLEIRHLEKRIDGRRVLTIEALAIEAGEVVAALGPEGSGKSLLIALLAGALPPSGGTILLDGNPLVAGPSRMREQMSVLFADDLLYERLSVWRNLAFACQWQGLPTSRISEVLAQIGLSDQAQTAAKRLPLLVSAAWPLRASCWGSAACSCSTSQPCALIWRRSRSWHA